LPKALSYDLLIPYFAYFWVMMAVGVTFVATNPHRIDMALLAGFIVSLLFFLVSSNFISVGVPIILFILTGIAVFYKLHT
jgi:hypothetical protein